MEDIRAGQGRGDFLALIHRNIGEERILSETFNKFWKRNLGNKPFRLVDFNLEIPAEQASRFCFKNLIFLKEFPPLNILSVHRLDTNH